MVILLETEEETAVLSTWLPKLYLLQSGWLSFCTQLSLHPQAHYSPFPLCLVLFRAPSCPITLHFCYSQYSSKSKRFLPPAPNFRFLLDFCYLLKPKAVSLFWGRLRSVLWIYMSTLQKKSKDTEDIPDSGKLVLDLSLRGNLTVQGPFQVSTIHL